MGKRLTTGLTAIMGASLITGFFSVAKAQTSPPATSFKYVFSAAQAPGFTNVTPTSQYTDAAGFGFEPGAVVTAVDEGKGDPLTAGGVTASKPFYFSVKVPEGNYHVTLTLGDPKSASTTTVKAELRRLMLEHIEVAAGQFVTKTISVNVRTPQFPGGTVRLKSRESDKSGGGEWWAWDDKLTLEFSDKHPSVCAIDIEKADDLPTVYICGDSTVCDQPKEPFNSWGQMITRWFKSDVVVANEAESGETTAAFYGEKRMDKVMSTIKKGDYVFVQFGHNDMKAGAVPLARYKALYEKFVADARSKGATPVICTPVSRKTFGADGKITNSFNGFPGAVREVAKEQKVMLIDLQNLTASMYEAIGKDNIAPAFANAHEATHHSDYGSYEISQAIIQQIKDSDLDLKNDIVDDFKGFDVNHPLPFKEFTLPADSGMTRVTPLGS